MRSCRKNITLRISLWLITVILVSHSPSAPSQWCWQDENYRNSTLWGEQTEAPCVKWLISGIQLANRRIPAAALVPSFTSQNTPEVVKKCSLPEYHVRTNTGQDKSKMRKTEKGKDEGSNHVTCFACLKRAIASALLVEGRHSRLGSLFSDPSQALISFSDTPQTLQEPWILQKRGWSILAQ